MTDHRESAVSSNSRVGDSSTSDRAPALAMLQIANRSSTMAVNLPVRHGLPLPAGAIRELTELCLTSSHSQLTYQLMPLTRWPDGSLRWILVECDVDVPARNQIALHLRRRVENHGLSIRAEKAPVSGDAPCSVKAIRRSGSAIPSLSLDGVELGPFERMDLELVGIRDQNYTFRQTGEVSVTRGAVKSTFHCSGTFVDESGIDLVQVDISIEVHGAPSHCTLRCTVHNSRAARHSGGFWDLGDAGSFRFKDLSIVLHGYSECELDWRTAAESPWQRAQTRPFCLSQLASGGPLQESPNHVNASHHIPTPAGGFRAIVDNEIVEHGNRSSPRVRMRSDVSTCTFCLEPFWQEFPKSYRRTGDQLRIGLFPADYPDTFELQGGEKKSHTLHIGFIEGALDWLDLDTSCSLDAETWKIAGMLPYREEAEVDGSMDALIEQGLDGPDTFYSKRERIDEYGWRHFGDVYADHETWDLDSPDGFCSHYNNQYDLLYGFMRQFALTARPQWFHLARDLAHHVMDIDIYDTRADRDEYNGGLFWHTDHYRPALTCTHRSYSASHDHASGEAAGGGPGGEHCYTTGLKLYYLMTGCEQARTTVLGLAQWVWLYYDGSGTLLEEIQRLLRSRAKVALAVVRGKVNFRHTYPLHRGIGNLVVAQLDAFEITDKRQFLDRAEHVVLGTIGPKDDLFERNLDKVEENWFYSIFLQALIRYLDVKRVMNEFDAPFFYARDSLLHYADWIACNERPYLDNPDALQFVNHTWVAQDIRRCAILLDAYRYSNAERPDLIERARFFANYVTTELLDEPTRTYTRILAILMQNHGASALALSNPERHDIPDATPYTADLQTPHTVGSLVLEVTKAFGSTLRRTSLRAEWRWLKLRLSR